MRNNSKRKNNATLRRRLRLRPIWCLSLLSVVCILGGVLFTFVTQSRASTDSQTLSTQVRSIATQGVLQQNSNVAPIAPQEDSNKRHQPTPVHPTVVASTPPVTPTTQRTQFGVFPLSAGGPLPVPESVLRPTNIARVMLGSTLESVYAGSMTRNPQAGLLCVLREDMTTGELHLQLYQGPQTEGALTILAVQNNILKIANTKMQGTFNLTTNTFQW